MILTGIRRTKSQPRSLKICHLNCFGRSDLGRIASPDRKVKYLYQIIVVLAPSFDILIRVFNCRAKKYYGNVSVCSMFCPLPLLNERLTNAFRLKKTLSRDLSIIFYKEISLVREINLVFQFSLREQELSLVTMGG